MLEAARPADASVLSAVWEVLGKAYACQQIFSKAEHAYSRALDLEQNASASSNDRLVAILVSRGTVYSSEGNEAEAVGSLERAQAILDRDPQTNSKEGAFFLNALAMMYWRAGRYPEAEGALRRGLAMMETATNPDPGITVFLLSNLGALALGHNQYGEAAAWYAKATDLVDKGAPVTPLDAAQALRNYAVCLRKTGDKSQAKELDSRADLLLSSLPRAFTRGQIVDVTQLAQGK
jgi:tetratricopeptide (TPR) repeat protein